MSENQDELKVQIKAWLKQQNISRNDFAAECFVSPNTVRNWLAKVAIPKDKEALIRLMMEKRKGRKTERGGKSQLEALCRHAEFRGLQTHRRSRQKGQHDGGGMGGSHPDQGCPEEDEKLLRRQQPSGRCIPGGGSTGGIRSSQTFRPFIISALFCPPQPRQ